MPKLLVNYGNLLTPVFEFLWVGVFGHMYVDVHTYGFYAPLSSI